ncbi:hypothetical protein M426DRAFT_325434 [Hypoxylon sp. CI-4A]|nr:hypothetical protein M426DRAFT_325434 [Hypoxylon sp. CI-4A]
MSETDQNTPLERRPACDNCKTRKTKCDRRSPCASCVTLNVACRTTRRAAEKRQRVLLSSKYDEAVQDVSRQLGDVKEMLQKLMLNKDLSPCPTGTSPEQTRHTSPPAMIDEQVPNLSNVREGYSGDPSFQSHAHRVKNALEAAFAASEMINIEAFENPTTLSPQKVAELLHGADTSDATTSDDDAAPVSNPLLNDLDFGNLPLPPVEFVLKLLRLTKTQKQQFFIDVPTFQEDEFIDMCRGVYFATEPISLWVWICVNVGLYYLFLGVIKNGSGRLGTTPEAVREHCALLRANAEAAMQSLRLCSEPSIESVRALALLGTFYVKEGHSTIAWRLISAAARACLDLGFHRLPGGVHDQETTLKSHIFWHIYSWEKGLAMTCGRTPVIHHYDVTTPNPIRPEYRLIAPGRIYVGFLEHAIVTGEIHQTLFSASSRYTSPQVRAQQVKEFASRLRAIQESVGSATPSDPTWDPMYAAAGATVDIMMYGLLTIVYRILPPTSEQSHPLQCSDECIDAARNALSKLVNLSEKTDSDGYGMLLNLILSLVPFAPFIVLAGNAIATSSSADLDLLSRVVSILEPTAAKYPTTKKIHDACERFGRVASLIVSNANESPLQGQVSNSGLPLNSSDGGVGHANPSPVDYGFPMAQQDWDSVMIGFESELGDYDSRALTNIIEPYIANTSW